MHSIEYKLGVINWVGKLPYKSFTAMIFQNLVQGFWGFTENPSKDLQSQTICIIILRSYLPIFIIILSWIYLDFFLEATWNDDRTDWMQKQIRESSCLLLSLTLNSFAKCKTIPLIRLLFSENVFIFPKNVIYLT